MFEGANAGTFAVGACHRDHPPRRAGQAEVPGNLRDTIKTQIDFNGVVFFQPGQPLIKGK